MDRRKFTFSALLGLLGLRVVAQEPTSGTFTVSSVPKGKFSDEHGGCYELDGKSFVGKRVPCKEGEEYCPLGHSQENLFLDFPHPPAGNALISLHVCAVCGVIYKPPR